MKNDVPVLAPVFQHPAIDRLPRAGFVGGAAPTNVKGSFYAFDPQEEEAVQVAEIIDRIYRR